MARTDRSIFSAPPIFMGRVFAALLGTLVAVAAVLSVASAARRVHAQEQTHETAAAALARANALVLAGQFQQALDAFREADSLSNHTCADCYLGMVKMESELGDLPGALADAQRAAGAAGDDPIVRSQALVVRAGLLIATSSGPTDEKMQEAEREYRQSLSLDPKRSIARFDLGMLLLEEGRDTEGVAEMKAYVSGPFASPAYVVKANRLIADPSRARALPAEDFSLSTIDGETISKAGLRGKVVLLDFWATWCQPCQESVPIMAELHRKFAGRGFELVGINVDANEEALRDFVASNHMDWPEFSDQDGQIQNLFEIQGYPTYVVLRRDGTIALQQTGLGADTAEELTGIITRELEKAYVAPVEPSAPTASTPPPPALAAARTGSASSAEAASARAASAPIELVFPPSDVENGDAEGNIYRNEFLGLSYKFPAAWTAATPEILDQLNNIQSQQMQARGASETSAPAGPNGFVRVPFPEIIFRASPDDRGRMPAVTLKVAQTSDSAQEWARRQAEMLKQQGLAILAPPHELTVGKRQFFRTDFEAAQADSPGWTAMIETSLGQRFVVTLEIRARSRQELDELAATAQTISVSKP
ncbi:MAG: TlpA disulfide reductase family protein [Candidatus Acidiferrales bacterium]